MKKLFMKKAPKEMTTEENRNYLEENNIPTHKSSRKTKFSGFSGYARDVAKKNQKDYNDPTMSSADDIYANQQKALFGEGGNPYARERASKVADNNPYAGVSSQSSSNPYSSSKNPYGDSGVASKYDSSGNGSPSGLGGEPLARATTGSTQNLRNELFEDAHSVRPSAQQSTPRHNFDEDDELNERPGHASHDDDELLMMPSELSGKDGEHEQPEPEAQEFMNSEDEETEGLKQKIRFTKQESVQSSRNALRVAAEAEASGRNALGMLGSQGERIANTERSLALAENQTKIAEEKSRELARLNRSIFVPNVSNPFTSKRRLQEKEARIKSEHMQEQVAREKRRQQAFASEQRVMNGLNPSSGYSETALRYKQDSMKGSEERTKFQFEEDSEDEDLENEIDMNLEGLGQASTRLQNLGKAMQEEVDTQNRRLDRITDQTDQLDIDVHLNAARMATLK